MKYLELKALFFNARYFYQKSKKRIFGYGGKHIQYCF